ncbi:hypothetical protein HPG69_015328 [Diceros bicornis minor]|uniref:Triacylglycerol lipase n=1 Tax=Diceros bicornis minor TaxID=77932 RepID=A0A7J7FJ11_DICBM|nr:hypothetical protein HPG69_015328 [Diceros bicornis minor]
MGFNGTGPRSEGGHWGPEESGWGRGGCLHGHQSVRGREVTRPEQRRCPRSQPREPTVEQSHPFSLGKEICYDRVGCFSAPEPWAGTAIRPLKVLPWSSENIVTRFLLYTNKNTNTFQSLLPSDPSTVEASNFQTDKKTRFIIQGFIDKGDESWLLDMCKSSLSYSPSNVHVIGHSLGAHVAGEAGRTTSGAIGRITGTVAYVACNHLRSYKYYNDSILNPSGFAGFSCASYSDFTANKCFPCPSEGCPQMGHYADKFPGRTSAEGQIFYLNTGDASNFARWRYKVTVTLSGKKVTGHVLVSLLGDKGNSRQYKIFEGTLNPGDTVSNEFDSDVEVGDVQKVKFLWNNNVINLTLPKVGASKITVERNDGALLDVKIQLR